MIITHRKVIPSFGMHSGPDVPVIIYTMLSINAQVRDCAAYECVGPDMSNRSRFNDSMRQAAIERMKGMGNKIPEAKARKLFDEIEQMELRYSK